MPLGLLNFKDFITVDTTFKTTNGYVTVLVARFIELGKCPAILVATISGKSGARSLNYLYYKEKSRMQSQWFTVKENTCYINVR